MTKSELSSDHENSKTHGVDKRLVHRIPAGTVGDFVATLAIGGSIYRCRIEDFHFGSVRVRFENGMPEGPIEALDIYYGKSKICSVKKPAVWRISKKDGVVLSLMEQRKSGERLNKRLRIKKSFKSIIIAHDPIKINYTINFEVLDISANGLLLATSLSNRHLISGLRFSNATLILAGVGIIQVDFTLAHARLQDERIQIGAKLEKVEKNGMEKIAQFMLFGTEPPNGTKIDTKYNEIKQSVSNLKKFGGTIRIETLSKMSDYQGVLELRLDAYKNVNKVLETTTIQDMADEYDAHSIIFIAKVDGAIIGTARMVYCNEQQHRFPFEKMLNIKSLKEFGNRNRYYEISRLAVNPNFQGTDLVTKFFKEFARVAGLNPEMITICMATNSLAKMYKKVGYREISGPVPHPVLKGESLVLLTADAENFYAGKKMSSLAWRTVVKDVVVNLEYAGIKNNSSKNTFKEFKATIQKMVLDLIKRRKT